VLTKILLALVPVLLRGEPTAPVASRAQLAAEAVQRSAARVCAPADRETCARLGFVWAAYESGWYADPPGSNDDGKACGTMQVHLFGDRCKAARASLDKGFDEGLSLMVSLRAKCGSWASGLTAYSMTGECPKGWTLPLVSRRMKLAGVAP
jgi:hypothetical protein